VEIKSVELPDHLIDDFCEKNHQGTNRKQIVKAEELYNKKRQKISPKTFTKNLH